MRASVHIKLPKLSKDMALKAAMSLESLGSLIWTEALMAVPRLVGHEVM
jgi:hypothetical protein